MSKMRAWLLLALILHLLVSQASKSPITILRLKSSLEPTPFEALHIGDDILGHPNGVIPTPLLLPNLVSNHLAICLLFYHIGGAMTFVPLVGLGVDERTFDCKLLLVLLIRNFLLWLRALVGLVVFVMTL